MQYWKYASSPVLAVGQLDGASRGRGEEVCGVLLNLPVQRDLLRVVGL
jgi:hypothetical protein